MPTKAEREGLMPVKGKTRTERLQRVDLNYLDVHSLVNELCAKYNQRNDLGIIKSFFKRKKIEAQDKQLKALSSLVGNIRGHARDLVEFKAQMMTQQEVLTQRMVAIVEGEEFAVARQREEHQTFLSQQQAERERALLELDTLKYENEKAKWEAEKAKYEAEAEKNKAWIIELRGKLIDKIIGELKFHDINMKQVFVLIEMIKESVTDSDILGAEERWEELKAETRLKGAHADQEQTKADWEKYKFEEDKKGPQD